MSYAEVADQINAAVSTFLGSVLASPRQLAAHLAALAGVTLVAAGAFVRRMTPLRWLAAGSNVGLLVYGALHPSPITFAVAAALLPVNLWRAVEVTRLTHRVRRAEASADLAGLWLRPYMKARRFKPGRVLFSKGDKADRLYMLVDGKMELADLGKPLEIGRIFGEIALFSPSGLRTHTVRCVTPCTVLEIHESTVMQLYYQNPAFGFHLIELLASRLSSDIERVQATTTSAVQA